MSDSTFVRATSAACAPIEGPDDPRARVSRRSDHRSPRRRAPVRAGRAATARRLAGVRGDRRPGGRDLPAAERLAHAPRWAAPLLLRAPRGVRVGQPPDRRSAGDRGRRALQPRRHRRQRGRDAGRPGRGARAAPGPEGGRVRQLDGPRAPEAVVPRRQPANAGGLADPQRLQRRRRGHRARRRRAAALRLRLAPGACAPAPGSHGGRDVIRRAVLSSPAARRFFAAHGQSCLGSGIAGVVLPLIAYDRFGSAWAVAGVLLPELLPAILLGPLLGALVDRTGWRTCAVVADVLRCLGFAVVMTAHSMPLMFAGALIAGLGTALFSPAALAGLPR